MTATPTDDDTPGRTAGGDTPDGEDAGRATGEAREGTGSTATQGDTGNERPPRDTDDDSDNEGTGGQHPDFGNRRRLVAIAGGLLAIAGIAYTVFALLAPNPEPEALITESEEPEEEPQTVFGTPPVVYEATPALRIDPAVIDFGTTAYEDRVPTRQVRVVADPSWTAGSNYEMTFDPVIPSGGGPRSTLPEEVPGSNTCRAGPIRPPRVERGGTEWTTFCELGLEWLPAPGEELTGTITVRVTGHSLTDGTRNATRTGQAPWDPVVLTATVRGVKAGPPFGRLTIEPRGLSWGPDDDEMKTATVTTTDRDGDIRVRGPLGGEWIVTDDCDESETCTVTVHPPETRTERQTAEIQVRWRRRGIAGDPEPEDVNDTMALTAAPESRNIETVTVRESSPVATEPPSVRPEWIDYGTITETESYQTENGTAGTRPVTLTEYVTFAAGTDPQAWRTTEVRSRRAADRATVRADTQGCEGRTIPAGGTCDVRIDWAGYAGQRLSAELRITVAGPKGPRTLTVPITAYAPTPAPEVDRIAENRRRHSLATQHGAIRTAMPDEDSTPGTAPRVIDPDGSEYGLPTRDSSRPIPGTQTVRLGEQISAKLTQTVTGGPATPVLAITDRDVFAAHGRALVIPAGTRLIGETGACGATGAGGGNAVESNGIEQAADAALAELSGASAVGTGLPPPPAVIDITWSWAELAPGQLIDLRGAVVTTDTTGRRCVPGHLDLFEFQNWVRRLASATVEAFIAGEAAASTATEATTTTGTDAGTAETTTTTAGASEARAQVLLGAVQAEARRIASFRVTPPTLTVAAGTHFHLFVRQPLRLQPLTGPGARPVELGREDTFRPRTFGGVVIGTEDPNADAEPTGDFEPAPVTLFETDQDDGAYGILSERGFHNPHAEHDFELGTGGEPDLFADEMFEAVEGTITGSPGGATQTEDDATGTDREWVPMPPDGGTPTNGGSDPYQDDLPYHLRGN